MLTKICNHLFFLADVDLCLHTGRMTDRSDG